MSRAEASDPSRVSHYVTDEFYQRLVETFSDWQQDENLVGDLALRDEVTQLLQREARLLDTHNYDAWLALFIPECIYWVPATREGGDPRSEIAVMFDDRRRLEDRIFRIGTGYAWSQAPQSRTVRLISNIEVFRGPAPDQLMGRSNFMINEFWGDETRILTGWTGHHLQRDERVWRIAAKQVNLIDCDQSIRNPSIIL